MIDVGLAKTVKDLNKKVPVIEVMYLSADYRPTKDFALVLVEFKDGQRFEINADTFKAHFKGFPFFMSRRK